MRKLLYTIRLSILAVLIPFVGFSQDGLVSHWDFTTGSMLDKAGSNNATNHGAEFKIGAKGMALRFDGSDYVDCGNNDDLRFASNTQDFSIVMQIKRAAVSGGYEMLLDMRDGDNDGWVLLLLNNNKLSFRLNTQDTDASSIIWANEYLNIIACVDRTDKVHLYVNGVELSYSKQQSVASQTITTTVNLLLGVDAFGAKFYYFNGDILNIIIYNKALSQDEIDNIQVDFLNSKTILPAKRNYTVKKPTEVAEDGLVFYSNCEPVGGMLVDGSGNNNDGTITNCVSTKDGLRSYGANMNSKVTFAAPLLNNATVWTVITKFRDYELGANDFYVGGATQKFLILKTSNKIGFRDSGGTYHLWNGTGNTVDVPSINIGNKKIDLVWVSNGTIVTLYVNGIDKGYIIPATTQIYISKLFEGYTGTAQTPLMTLQEVKIYNTAKDEDFVKAYHNSWASQTYLIENFEGNGADEIVKVPREWNANCTGNYFIGELATDDAVLTDLTAGTKYMECSFGGGGMMQNKQAYGTFECVIYKGADGNRLQVILISDRIANVANGTFSGYYFQFRETEKVRLMKNIYGGGASELFATADSYFSNNTCYGIMVERTPDGEFTVYIRGGLFGNDYTLIDVTGGSGSNPVVDQTHTKSEYFGVDNDAGDIITKIHLTKGVIQ